MSNKTPLKLESHVVMREVNGEAPYGKAYVAFEGPNIHSDIQYTVDIEFVRSVFPDLAPDFVQRAKDRRGITFKLTLEEVRV